MSRLFYELESFNADISNWDTSSVTNMYGMFYVTTMFLVSPPHPTLPTSHSRLSARQLASAFNQPLSFDTSKVTTMYRMFWVRSARALPSHS